MVTIKDIVTVLWVVLGICTLIIVWMGFKYSTSCLCCMDKEDVKKAKRRILISGGLTMFCLLTITGLNVFSEIGMK